MRMGLDAAKHKAQMAAQSAQRSVQQLSNKPKKG
jgi:hypothetical protein